MRVASKGLSLTNALLASAAIIVWLDLHKNIQDLFDTELFSKIEELVSAKQSASTPRIASKSKREFKLRDSDYERIPEKIRYIKIVEEIGRKAGLPEYYMATTAAIESDFIPNIVNKGKDGVEDRCDAAGMWQFKCSAAEDFNLMGNGYDHRKDFEKSTKAMVKLALRNKRRMARDGIDVSNLPGEYLYHAHNLGGGGASEVIRLSQGIIKTAGDKRYQHMLSHAGERESEIAAIGKATPEVARIFLEQRNYIYEWRKWYVKWLLSQDV